MYHIIQVIIKKSAQDILRGFFSGLRNIVWEYENINLSIERAVRIQEQQNKTISVATETNEHSTYTKT